MMVATLGFMGLHCVQLTSVAASDKPAPQQNLLAPQQTLLVLGDSWSAEYGLKRGQGWVSLLDTKLKGSPTYKGIRIINASISGETTAGGVSRLPALLEKHRPRWVVIALGGNDALRGLPLETTRSQLLAMIKASKARSAKVLLIGMRMPPNYGSYGQSFERLFPALAKEQKVGLVPFLMQGKEFDLSFFQADRIHPNEAAQPHMLAQAWPAIEALVRPAGVEPARSQ
ncbi:MAG: arylesterase [Betaproteobacteria bacterium]|nr:arylesterase [Betaproteobacteria bacterium]